MEFHQEQEEDEDEEMPLPINSTYGHNHIVSLSHHHHHHHHKPPVTDVSTTVPPPQPPSSSTEEISKKMVMGVRYKECLKNHAASMGGKATDGCGEFMPGGEEGTMEAFTCSVCNCHRNFHRKEIEGGNTPTTSTYDFNYQSAPSHLKSFHLGSSRNLFLQAHQPKGVLGTESLGYNHNNNNNGNNAGALVPSRGPPPMIMSYNMAMGMGMGMGMGSFPSESDDQVNGGGFSGGFMSRYPPQQQQQVVKKRFRTKFTQEQKEKMVTFAEKVGWKIQRQDESVVQDFCQEIGIKRRVLKVWMHNNKQNLAKNTNSISINPPDQHPS